MNFSTIVDILKWRAEHQPDRVAYSFLEDGEAVSATLTYATLDQRARVLAGYLLGRGAPGERALLLYPPGVEFLIGFFGCLYAGVIAVPLYPPKLNRRDARCVDVTLDASARFALTTSAVLEGCERAFRYSPELVALRWIAPDALSRDAPLNPMREHVDPDSLAYLQYTSGSTRNPKGVMVSHRNLMANIDDFRADFLDSDDSVPVSWLPHFHDMGLVYGLLVPLAFGVRGYFMPPAAFLQKPLRWLQAMSRFGGTHSGGPNFAYELCAQRVGSEQKHELDLTRWKVAINGAEPVRRQTLQKFSTAFASCGFAPRAMCPGYGLAEATLKVTLNRSNHEPAYFFASATELGRSRVNEAAASNDDAKDLVGCGCPEPGTEVLIVDPTTRVPSGPGEIGEIWVDGPGVALGYWNRPDESAAVFRAAPAGDRGRSHFLRTGDLGFLHDGELFVTGRIKDLIIIRGRNHYPHDIELTVQNCHPALRVDAGAAVSLDIDGEERLVLVQEIDRHRHGDAESAVALIRAAIADEHEVAPYAIVLVRQNGVPKTSSGKIQRSACALAFREGRLPVVCEWRDWNAPTATNAAAAEVGPRTREDIEDFLLRALAQVLSIVPDQVDVSQPFNSFGLDSLRTLTLVGDVEKWLGQPVSPTVFWNYPTIADLAGHLAQAGLPEPIATGDRGV